MDKKTTGIVAYLTWIGLIIALVAGDKEGATKLFPYTCSIIDSAVSKGVIKKNTAANKKSGLAKKLNAMA